MKKYKAAWLGGSSFGDAASIAVDDAGHRVGYWVSSSESFAHHDLPRCWAPGEVELEWVKPDELPPPCPGCDQCLNPPATAPSPQ